MDNKGMKYMEDINIGFNERLEKQLKFIVEIDKILTLEPKENGNQGTVK